MSDAFIDTDVTIRLLTGDDLRKQAAARALFQRVEAGSLTLAVTFTVLSMLALAIGLACTRESTPSQPAAKPSVPIRTFPTLPPVSVGTGRTAVLAFVENPVVSASPGPSPKPDPKYAQQYVAAEADLFAQLQAFWDLVPSAPGGDVWVQTDAPRAQLTRLAETAGGFRTLVPPPCYSSAHEEMTQALALYEGAARSHIEKLSVSPARPPAAREDSLYHLYMLFEQANRSYAAASILFNAADCPR